MNAEEKSAWFIIGVSTAALIVFLILAPFLGFKAAMGSFGLFGFAGLTPLFFRKQPGKVASDERDRIIVRKAAVAGGMSSYLVFVAGCMAAWFIKMVRSEATIDITVLPLAGLLRSGRSVFGPLHRATRALSPGGWLWPRIAFGMSSAGCVLTTTR